MPRIIQPGDAAIGYRGGDRSMPLYIEMLPTGLVVQIPMTLLQEQLVRCGFETTLADLEEELSDIFGWDPLPVDERLIL